MKNLTKKTCVLVALALAVAIMTALFGFLLLKIQTVPSQHFKLIIYLLPVLCLINHFYQKKFPQFKDGTRALLSPTTSNSFFRWHFVSITLMTWISHLFGASVGRESTALQIGGSLATWVKRNWTATTEDDFQLRIMGMIMGFSALFGTPFAAVFFVLEVAKKWSLKNFCWGSFSSFLAYWIFELLSQGQMHFQMNLSAPAEMTFQVFTFLLFLGCALGLLALIFLKIHQFFSDKGTLKVQLGASLLLVLCFTVFHHEKLTGLSLPALNESFQEAPSSFYFAEKMLVTLLSSAAGFQGGEVTPVFVIGATFGASFADFFELPVPLFAAAGLVGLFAAITRSPWGSFFIGIELFGINYSLAFALVILVSLRIAPRQGLFSLR